MNPSDVLLSGEYPPLSPLGTNGANGDFSGLGLDDSLEAGPGGAVTGAGTSANLNGTLDANSVAQILIAVNQTLNIDLGDMDYTQYIVTDGGDDERGQRDSGKREFTHVQLVCEACGHIIIAVSKAVNQAIAEAAEDPEARSTIPKRKRGGILGFKELAAKAKLSPWHFHRVFRSITDVTPKAYGEACWDYLLRSHGFDLEPKSPQVVEKAPVRGPGRIAKNSSSRSRSRSRSRHPSQTQAQVLSVIAAANGGDESITRNHHRSRSAARASSFSRYDNAGLGLEGVNTSLGLGGPLSLANNSAAAAAASHQSHSPLQAQAQAQAQQTVHQAQQQAQHGPQRARRNSTPQPLSQPVAQPLTFLPPGTVSGSIGAAPMTPSNMDYMYVDPPSMYENLTYPDTFLPSPKLESIIPNLDSTIESTPSTGFEILEESRNDLPDLDALTLSKELEWKRDDPSLAPNPDLASQFFIKEEDTPEFNTLKLLDPIEEPSLFVSDY